MTSTILDGYATNSWPDEKIQLVYDLGTIIYDECYIDALEKNGTDLNLADQIIDRWISESEVLQTIINEVEGYIEGESLYQF